MRVTNHALQLKSRTRQHSVQLSKLHGMRLFPLLPSIFFFLTPRLLWVCGENRGGVANWCGFIRKLKPWLSRKVTNPSAMTADWGSRLSFKHGLRVLDSSVVQETVEPQRSHLRKIFFLNVVFVVLL